MHWVDIAILVIVIGSTVVGVRRGLVVETAGILGLAVALFVARQEYGPVRTFLRSFLPHKGELTILAFLVVLVVVWALVLAGARAVRGAVRMTPLGVLDRIGGAVLGLALGLFMVQALILLANASDDGSLQQSIHASHLAQTLNHTVPGLRRLIPSNLNSLVN